MSRNSNSKPAFVHNNYDELRRMVAAEVDEINKLQGVKKKCSLTKADEIIRLRYDKQMENWVKKYGVKK